MYKYLATVTAVGLSVSALPMAANAASLDVQSLISGFTVVSLGDFDADATDHIEGTIYVGGDYTATANVTDANRDGLADVAVGDVTGSLIVGGDLNVGTINSAQLGNVVVGGSTSATNNSTGTLTTGVGTDVAGGVPVAEMVSLFQTLASDLSSLSETSGATISGDNNNATLVSGAGDDGVAVINLETAEEFIFLSNLSFTIDADVTLIVNVAGTDWTSADFQNGKVNTDEDSVLFNFYEAETLTFNSGAFNASVLAAYADVTTAAGGTNGTIVGETVTLGGEVRPFDSDHNFDGTLPVFAAAAPTTAVPVPAALPLAATGLALLGFVGRRRKAAA